MTEDIENGEPQEGIKRKTLGFARAFKLMQWIGINKEKILHDLPTYQEAANWAQRDLGFDVTETNIRSVAKDTEQVWKPRRNAAGGQGTGNLWTAIKDCQKDLLEAKQLIEQLLTDNQKLHAQLAIIRGAVVTIAREAGCKTTPAFASRNDAPNTSVLSK